VPRRKHSNKVTFETGSFSDWATWVIRLLVPAIALVIWNSYNTLNELAAEVRAHSQQLTAIWRTLEKLDKSK